MTRDQYIFLGSVIKIRGIKGELVVRTKKITSEIKKKLETVMVDIDGLLVPFFILSWHISGNDEIVLFIEDIKTPEKAKELKDRDVYIHLKDFTRQSTTFSSEVLNGYLVTDKKSGNIGIVKGILEIPENPLLRIIQDKREILLPLQKEMILEIDEKNRLIRVDLPEGFLEI